jgi:hypothetical protein
MTTKPKTRKAPASAKAATIPSGAADDLYIRFFKGRDPLEIERIKTTLEAAFPRPSKAEEIERDTAVQEAEEAQERLTDLNLVDEMDRMTRRCSGLESAIYGAVHYNELHGVLHIAVDITKAMEPLAKDLEAERQLRIAEGAQ